jgi:hypothetical protein
MIHACELFNFQLIFWQILLLLNCSYLFFKNTRCPLAQFYMLSVRYYGVSCYKVFIQRLTAATSWTFWGKQLLYFTTTLQRCFCTSKTKVFSRRSLYVLWLGSQMQATEFGHLSFVVPEPWLQFEHSLTHFWVSAPSLPISLAQIFLASALNCLVPNTRLILLDHWLLSSYYFPHTNPFS